MTCSSARILYMEIAAARLLEHEKPLVIESIDLAEPGVDEVTVDLAYAGVNPIDRYTAAGLVASDGPLPRTLGGEATGHVDGRPVLVNGCGLGAIRDGVYASAAVVPRQAVLPLPAGTDLVKAAGLGVVGLTAWTSVHKRANVTSNDRVLVLGAGGGVGLTAVAIAQREGAEVWGQIGTASKRAAVVNAGADNVIVCDAYNLASAIEEFHPTVIIDPLGGPFTDVALSSLAVNGRLVIFGTSAGARAEVGLQVLYRNNISVLGYGGLTITDEERRSGLSETIDAFANGLFDIFVERTLALDSVNDAFALLADRKVTGKIILELS